MRREGARRQHASRWRARPGAAPTRRSTTISASGCCTAPRTARSTRSSRAGSSARSRRCRSGWRPAEEPALVKVANIQHLATPVRAQLAEPRSAVELAGVLHPTPAVGGEPWELARERDAQLERMDRGWYAAPVGWMDAAEDGEFCVALRCALLEGRTRPLLCGRRRGGRLRPRGRAGRDRGQAPGAAAGADRRLTAVRRRALA